MKWIEIMHLELTLYYKLVMKVNSLVAYLVWETHPLHIENTA
jgi:hypothetical protein